VSPEARRRAPGANWGRIFAWLVALLAIATVAGLALLWPSGDTDVALSEGLSAETELGVVERVTAEACPPPQPGNCGQAEARLESGPDAGQTVALPIGGGPIDPGLEPGDEIRVAAAEGPATPAEGPTAPPAEDAAPTTAPVYNLVDFERRAPMLWLGIAFVLLVVAFGRLRGALSLLGLGLSLAIVLVFIVPAILEGEAPLAVSLVGAMAVMLTTITLAHGLGPKSLAAILGTAASLALVALLALAFTDLTHLTGLSSEEATLLQLGGAEISLQHLLLAGMVIGALGVLDDVTVSQASTVLALRSAEPEMPLRELYGSAMRVGRDHVSATVNTLVLAYVGASLPVLLIFSSSELGISEAINLELVAKEIVATLVGSIGLIAAVPLTTLLAATLSRDAPIRTSG
jgi:uncharacterized membrane protein